MAILGRAKEGQDAWVLAKLLQKRQGFFVDLGAHDGVHDSNTLLLEKEFGWTGICVEPHPRSFAALCRNRRCACENVCVYGRSGQVQFVVQARPPQHSGIFDDDCSRSIRRAVDAQQCPTVSVAAVTLNELLAKHHAPQRIDYLSIDTEGSEYQILSQCDFDKYTFAAITVEHNCFGGNAKDSVCRRNKDRIYELLTHNGYVFDKSVVADDWYVHHSVVVAS